MQRTFIAVFALGLSLSFVGCNKNKSEASTAPALPPTEQPAHVVAWEAKLQSSCAEDVAAENCLASQGFTVDADGNFKVGPAANGRIITGTLSPESLQSLKDKLVQAELLPVEGQASISNTAAEQKVAIEEAESNDIVTLTLANQEAKQVVHNQGTDLFFITGATEPQALAAAAGKAQALQEELRTLARTHYPLPFPNLCMDKVNEVTTTVYPLLQTCQVDADCSYVDWYTDTAIPPGANQFVITDNGNYLLPLIVANSSSLADPALNAKLMEAYTQVDAVCKYQREDFIQQKGFNANQGAPVCDTSALVCKVNPSIQL